MVTFHPQAQLSKKDRHYPITQPQETLGLLEGGKKNYSAMSFKSKDLCSDRPVEIEMH